MKKELAMKLETLEGFTDPQIELEQYVTPPTLAAEIMVNAHLMGDLDTIVDLGCGTGILAIAASLLGANSIGFDADVDAVRIARKNARKLGTYVEWVICRVEDVCLKKKVVTMMNPPFGIQRRHADRPFLARAMDISKVIYSVHSAGSESFISSQCESRGFEITHIWRYQIPLRRSYKFHEKDFKYVPVEVFRLKELMNYKCNR
ncbi:MAG: METTL5 family protein [Archaeoglobaceae archaeon]